MVPNSYCISTAAAGCLIWKSGPESDVMSLFPVLVLNTQVLGQDKYGIFGRYLVNREHENNTRKTRQVQQELLKSICVTELKCTNLLALI